MEDHAVGISPQFCARLGGLFYLVIIAFGVLGETFVRGRLVVSGDATATAEKIRGSEFLWRASAAGELFYLTLAVALALIFYVLLRPVSSELALLAAFFNLVSIAVEATNRLHLLAALRPLAEADYLRVFEPEQRHALAYLSIQAHTYGFGVALIFFGCVCLVWGYLIFRAGYLPRFLGVLLQIAGICYLTNSFALILSPPLASKLFPTILLPCFVAEATLCVWLLVRGVDVEKWEARAGPGGTGRAPALEAA